MARRAPFLVTVFVVFMAGGAVSRAAEPQADHSRRWGVVERGTTRLPGEAAGPEGVPLPIVGVSGVSWMGGDRYIGVMDNGRRLLAFRLRLAADGRPLEVSQCSILEVAEPHDYEDIVWLPAPRVKQDRPDDEPLHGRVILCEEDTPGIHAFELDGGRKITSLDVPAIFSRRRPNRGFEAVALDVGGRHVWVANEEALLPDGPAAAPGEPTVVRLTRLPITPAARGGTGALQLAYAVDPPHQFVRILEGEPLSGLTAIAAVTETTLLVLERSAGQGFPPFSSRIYLVRIDEAGRGAVKDVSSFASGLAARSGDRVRKELLWSGELGLNIEGLCLGPELAVGGRSVVAVADNGGLGTPSQLVGFQLTSP